MILADFKILAFQNPEFKILSDFRILAFQNPEFKRLDDFNILAFQNHEFMISADLKILWKWRNDRHSERNLCNFAKKPDKIQDFNGVWTRDLAIPLRCSTNWAMKPLTLVAG